MAFFALGRLQRRAARERSRCPYEGWSWFCGWDGLLQYLGHIEGLSDLERLESAFQNQYAAAGVATRTSEKVEDRVAWAAFNSPLS